MNLRMLLAICALIVALPALAHEVTKGPHGGRVVEAGDYHVELVAQQSLVDVFLTDASDKPIAPAGFKGVAILVVGGKSVRVTLEPMANTSLAGKAPSALPADTRGVVQITSPQGKTVQAKFH